MKRPFNAYGLDTPREDLLALWQLVRKARQPDRDWSAEPPLRVVEVGSWVGRTALTLLDAGAAEVHCIDTWQGSKDDVTGLMVADRGHEEVFSTFLRNIGPALLAGIWPHVGTSALWARHWPWQADLVFIDADHSYQAVQNDIRLWTPHVRRGGILCGHDYGVFDGVTRAVSASGPFERAGRCLWWRRILG